MKKRKVKALCAVMAGAAGVTAAICHVLNKREKHELSGETESIGSRTDRKTFYEKYVKRVLDVSISFCGLIVLSPVIAVSSAIVFLEDPGNVIFKQKRVGIHKTYFHIHKLRSMKQNCPDIPTHLMENPDQYILKSGKVFRKYSIDELTQLIDIIRGKMSIVGPRPALWNQDDLVAERDKYGANDVMPGLTGWAQINGRDELEIPVKAKLDGEYVQVLKKSSISGFMMDCKCFIGTITSVLHHDGVVEGGTGELHKEENSSDTESVIGFEKSFTVNENAKKKVLITGAGSYIGESFESYAKEHYADNFEIDTLDMIDEGWKNKDFRGYDIVYHVAGIAHADVGNVSEETRQKYYAVNTELAIDTAKKAKEAGVKLFVFMSSMIVYGDSAPYGKQKMITAETKPEPANFYGDSKWQADKGVRALADADFKVAVLRPPMIYGKGSKGNYPTLAKMAKKLPVFPDVENQRSMLYIENLCEFLCQIFLVDVEAYSEHGNLFFPQNAQYTRTSEMVKLIAEAAGHRIVMSKVLAPMVFLAGKVPGKVGGLVDKAFGSNCYAQDMREYQNLEYRVVNLKESIRRAEGKECNNKEQKPKALMLASVASMIDQFNMNNIRILLDMGYDVDVVADFVDGGTITTERIQDLKRRLDGMGVEIYHVPIPRKVTNFNGIIKSYQDVKALCKEKRYKLVHCHSPIGGVVARLVARKFRRNGTRVIYTAHGFHFYKGAPIINWLAFYPIEKICSYWTDVLITINKEDYRFAQTHMKARRVEYIPGVGVDVSKFKLNDFDIETKRAELGICVDDIVLLSVGELNQNKNHEVIVRAISELNNDRIHYFIAGQGAKEKELVELATKLNVNLHLLGYRTDIAELYNMADIFVFPSIREGLSVSLMEAMASGLPCVVSNIRGNVDLIENSENGYLCSPENENQFAETLELMLQMTAEEKQLMVDKSKEIIRGFDTSLVKEKMKEVYSRCLK